MFLGVDGGGTKTSYAVIDADGRVCARQVGPSVSHLAQGFARATDLLLDGIGSTLRQAVLAPTDLTYAFLGLPSYGEDSATTAQMDLMPARLLDVARYRCGNDMSFRDSNGRLVMLDDPGFDPVWHKIEALGVPLIGHLGEPHNCWLPLDQMTTENDRSYFREHPEYYMNGVPIDV